MNGIDRLKFYDDSFINLDISMESAESLGFYWSGNSWELLTDEEDNKLKIVKMKFTSDDKPVAELELRLVFSADLFYSPAEMVEYVDDFDVDNSDGFSNLVYSEEFNLAFESIVEEYCYQSSYSGLLQTLYVYPEYRQNGIASFIINNLRKILLHYCGWEILCLITYLNPYMLDKKGKHAKSLTADLNTAEQEMLDVMRHSVVKWGFTELEEAEDHYIKVYELSN